MIRTHTLEKIMSTERNIELIEFKQRSTDLSTSLNDKRGHLKKAVSHNSFDA